MTTNRRRFLEFAGISGSVLASTSWGQFARAMEGNATPDLVVYNARITTMDPTQPRAQAFAIKGDRFIAVGSSEEIKSLAGPRTRHYDAKGMMITPGFIDTHNHVGGEALLGAVIVGDAFGATPVTVESIVDKIRAAAAKTPPGQWIEGRYFDDTKVVGGRALTRYDLDKATTQHPVRVWLRGGHASIFNTFAINQGGITKNTPDPQGGHYEKDAKGELTGRISDAAELALAKFGTWEQLTPDQRRDRQIKGLELMTDAFAKYGITSICWDDAFDEMHAFEISQEVRRRGGLKTRINVEPGDKVLNAMIGAGIKSGFGDEWVRFGGAYEHALDGGLSSRTMSMTRPYLFTSPPYKGNLYYDQKQINEWAERVHRAGIRMNTHCNGEPAIEQALIAFESVLTRYPKADARPKFVHCSAPSDTQIQRIKALGGAPSHFSTYIFYNADKFKYYGADMAEHMIPYASMLKAGVLASTGSDFSAGPFDPLMAIQGMVTRKGFNGEVWGTSQKIGVEDAIRFSTINGAWNTFEEGLKGSIKAGKLADYVVLAEDLYSIDPEHIRNVQIVQTVVGGVVRHQA